MSTRLLALAPLALGLALVRPAFASHSLADRVKDGPAAAIIRESYRLFEEGEACEDDATKLGFYQSGKELAERAVKEDERNPEAHFALFANWGRWLQTDGWLKNSIYLPSLWRELDRTLALDPNHADAIAAEGGLYLQLPRFLGGDVVKAQALLERAVVLDPESPGAQLELARCYFESNRRDEAREHADLARRIAVGEGRPRFVRRADEMLRELGPPPQREEARLDARVP